MPSISYEVPDVEVVVSDALDFYEAARSDWEDEDFYASTREDLEDLFPDICSEYEDNISCEAGFTPSHWDGDDFRFEVDSESVDDIISHVRQLTTIQSFYDLARFILVEEDGTFIITSENSAGRTLGAVSFTELQEDEEDEEDEDTDEDETEDLENDFVDLQPRKQAISQPAREVGNNEQAAIDALEWLGRAFNISTEDRRNI